MECETAYFIKVFYTLILIEFYLEFKAFEAAFLLLENAKSMS